jgi:hypothetical protein
MLFKTSAPILTKLNVYICQLQTNNWHWKCQLLTHVWWMQLFHPPPLTHLVNAINCFGLCLSSLILQYQLSCGIFLLHCVVGCWSLGTSNDQWSLVANSCFARKQFWSCFHDQWCMWHQHWDPHTWTQQ